MAAMSDAIFVLAPAAVPQMDFRINNAGSGDVLTWLSNMIPQPSPEAIAAVTQEQVDAAKIAVDRSAAAQVALLSNSDEAMANRADAKLQWTAINDHAEILGMIMAKLGITKDQFVADITARRDAWKAAVGHDFEQQPTDPGVMFDELTRLAQSLIVQALGAAIIGGVGDPIKV